MDESVHPLFAMTEFHSCFRDEDDMHDFIESLNDEDEHNLRIIMKRKDPNILIQMKKRVQDDINDAAKQLAMED